MFAKPTAAPSEGTAGANRASWLPRQLEERLGCTIIISFDAVRVTVTTMTSHGWLPASLLKIAGFAYHLVSAPRRPELSFQE